MSKEMGCLGKNIYDWGEKDMPWIFEQIGSAFIGIIIGALGNFIWTNRKRLSIAFQGLLHSKEEYRISYAYLFRIKIDNMYLLIKGRRISQYQPVGGVYKFYDSFKSMFNDWEIRSEKNKDFYEDKDLRIFVKGKYLSKFLDWIDSGKNREIDVNREFCEELVKPGYISAITMNDVDYEFINHCNSGIHYSPHFGCKEIFLADIYDVHISSEDAIRALKEKCTESRELVLVEQSDIEKECIAVDGVSTKIGAHAKNIL
jgi:hypothetical protein